MSFNHYAKIKRILASTDDWVVHRINQSTTATKFNGEKTVYPYYYRVCLPDGTPIKFCKFQQLERFASTMKLPAESILIIDDVFVAKTE